jgi:hypothetical protein
MLGLGRAAVPRSATFQTSDQIVVQIPHMQVTGHPTPYEIIVLNDLKLVLRQSRGARPDMLLMALRSKRPPTPRTAS